MPRWLSEGISVFEEKRARPEWGREMDIPFARAIDRGQVLKMRDLNSGFSNPQTISLAYYQASLLVEHIVEHYGQPKLRALVAVVCRRHRHRGGDQEGARRRHRRAAEDVRRVPRASATATLRRALTAPEGLTAGHAGRQAEGAGRGQSRELRRADGARRGAAQTDPGCGDRGVRDAPRRWCRTCTGADSPQAADCGGGARRRATRRARRKALDTLTGYDHTDVASARKLATLLDPDEGRRRGCRPRCSAWWRSIRSIAPSHTTLGRMALNARRHGRGGADVPRRAGRRPARSRRRARRPGRRRCSRPGNKDEAASRRWPRSRSRRPIARAQDLLLKLIGGQR